MSWVLIRRVNFSFDVLINALWKVRPGRRFSFFIRGILAGPASSIATGALPPRMVMVMVVFQIFRSFSDFRKKLDFFLDFWKNLENFPIFGNLSNFQKFYQVFEKQISIF